MRTIALVAAAALLACSSEESAILDSVRGWYSIDGETVTCHDASEVVASTDQVLCAWYCVPYEGRMANSVFLDFRREDAGSPWRLLGVSHEYSRVDECVP